MIPGIIKNHIRIIGKSQGYIGLAVRDARGNSCSKAQFQAAVALSARKSSCKTWLMRARAMAESAGSTYSSSGAGRPSIADGT